MKWFRDRKTVILCSIIVVLASTNLYTIWNARRAVTNAPKDSSASLSQLPLEVACRPLAEAANAEVLTVQCSLANPTKADLKRTTLTLKDASRTQLS